MRSALAMSRRWLHRLGIAALVLVAIVIGGFGVLQTPIGRDWLGRALAGAASGPGVYVVVEGLDGRVPFQMRARRIAMADDRGVWLSLSNVVFDLSPGELVTGRARVRTLTAETVNVARLPAAPSSTAPPSSLAERLRVPSLPLPVAIDRLAIDRITIDPSIIGDRVEASLIGSAAVDGHTLQVMLDLHRTDSNAGNLAFRLGISGTPPVLALRLTADEPTGALLGHMLHRGDHPALLVSLTGEGPLAAWHGRLEASADSLARFDADLSLIGIGEPSVTLSGIAAVDRLLPPDIAPLIGTHAPVALRATVKENGAIALDNLSVELASGTLMGDAALAGPDRAIAAHLRAIVPRLQAVGGVLGAPMAGSAEVVAAISGTEERPRLDLDAIGDNIVTAVSGAEHAEAHLKVTATSNLSDPSARIGIAARGQVRGVTLPDPDILSAAMSRDLSWSLTATAAPDGSAVELSELSAVGIGLDLAGAGVFDRARDMLNGRIRLAVDDLRPFAGVVGRPLEGAVTLDATAQQQMADRIAVQIDGSITRLRSGVPVIDALGGEAIAIAGSGQRDPAGVLQIDRLTLTAAGTSLDAGGHFDPATRQLAATLNADIRQLQPLGVALGTALAGRLTARISAEGPIDHASLHGQIDGADITAGPALFDRVQLAGSIADLAQPRISVTGEFRGGGLDGTLALDADLDDRADLAIRHLQVKAADGVADGDLRIDLTRLLAGGTLRAKVPDLSRWSRLAGIPLAGSLDIKAGLADRGSSSAVSPLPHGWTIS